MVKQFTSTLSTDQLIALAKKILNPADVRHVDSLMRAHVTNSTPNWNRQELIAFIAARNGGTPPDQILDNMAAAALRKQTASTKREDGGGAVVNFIDLSQQNQSAAVNPNTLVAHPCSGGCGIRLAVPISDVQTGAATCWCPNCLKVAQGQQKNDEAAFKDFLVQVPQFYNHPHNLAIIDAEIVRRNLQNVSADDLIQIYIENRSRMLGKVSVEQMNAMLPEDFKKRIEIDPACGGAIDAMNAATKTPEMQHWSSNKQRFGQSFERTGVSSLAGR